MNIGIYLAAIDFKFASHLRLHTAILEGLARKNKGRHNLIVLTWSAQTGSESDSQLKFVTLRKNGWGRDRWNSIKWRFATIGLKLGRAVGLRKGKWVDAMRAWQYSQPEYYAQLKELEIDVIWHCMGIEQLPSNLPSIITVLDINHRIHPEYWPKSYHQHMESVFSTLHLASFLITGTNEGKRQLVSSYNVHEPKIRIIPFPTPLLPNPQDIPAMDLGLEVPYIFYPARFWRHKNHVVAVAALKILRDKWNIRMNLVFSGKGGKGSDEVGNNLEYVMDYAQTLGVFDQVKHVGEVPLVELTALYKHAFALTYVSATGPDNLPPLEAMSLGCPAIVADVPGAREQYGDACLFHHPMDEHALAEHIKFLLENPAAREALIAKGYERARKWTGDDYVDAVISVFDEFALIARAWGRSSDVFY